MANSTATKLPCSQFGCSYSPQLVLHGNGASCCDSSQQIQDGLPGQSVCPCQLDRVLQHRITSMPVNVLPRPPFGDGAFTIGSGSGLSAFYSPLTRTCDFKDMAQPWRDSWYLSQASRNPFEFHGFDPHTHAACTRFAERFSPIDLAAAGARRKNATRETTSTLKAWLYEHRKNPYPTKGEKIMLAILTKMTLTQVSTWFANARRRLKKENKMTWSPRNRCGERKDGGESSDVEDIDLDINSDDEKPSADSHSHGKLQENESNDIKKENTAEKNEVNNDEKSYRDFTNVGSDNCENSCLGVDETTTVAPAPARRAVPTLITKRELEVSGSVEDSPVKSLRKWVDGCFYSPVMSSCPVPQPSSPVQNQQTTPPTTHRTSTETPVITSAPSSNSYRQEEREGSEAEEKSPNSVVRDDTLRHEEEEKSSSNTAINPTEKRTNEMKNYREFDAALALTTLSSR